MARVYQRTHTQTSKPVSVDFEILRSENKPRVKRIYLVSLPAVVYKSDTYLNDGHSFHLGLAYLASMMRSAGYEVGILDAFAENTLQRRPSTDDQWFELGLTDAEIVERVKLFRPDLIGMTVPFSCQTYIAHQVAREIKAALPDVPIVAGGNHVTAAPQELDRSLFEYLVKGEGELAFLDLVRALNLGLPTNSIPGVIPPGSHIGLPANSIQNLDILPFPAIDLLPLHKIWASDKRWIIMVATRGCANDCVFCSIHTVMGYTIRRRSIENVLAEIDYWKKQYDIQTIYFEDDNLTANKAWAKELFRRIAEREYGLRLYARNGIRADTVDEELLQLMKAAGFQDFMVAPESGSQETLDHIIGKKFKLTDVENAITLAKKINLDVVAFLVIGFPGETRAAILQTLDYGRKLKRIGASGIGICLASPYPGTRLFNQCQEQGLLPEPMDYRQLRIADYLIRNPLITADELKTYQVQTMKELSESHTLFKALWHGLRLFFLDRPYFFVKLRHRLNLGYIDNFTDLRE